MLKLYLTSICIFAAFSGSSPQTDTDPQVAALRLANALDATRFVKFYFLTVTGEYSFEPERFKAESSIRIYRECGANCRRFMDDVITHLSKATEVACDPGQQNILIEIGENEMVVYSYSGRMIRFQNKCYFNETSINSTIKNADFLF